MRWAAGVAALGAVVGISACGSGSSATGSGTAPQTLSGEVTTTVGTLTATIADPSTLTTSAGAPGVDSTTGSGAGATDPGTVTLPGSARPPVLLGDMNTPEQFIIGALYQDALEAQGYLVELSRNIGATAVSQAALKQGSLDVYPEYLNIYLAQVAGDTHRYSTRRSAYRAAQLYAAAHGQALLAPTPFADNAGIAVRAGYARAHHLQSIGDLRRVQGDLTLGAPLEYLSEPNGLRSLTRTYHLAPAITATITLGTQYQGLDVGTLNAAYVQTSDWELTERRYRVLSDPRHVFGFGNVVPVLSAATLAQEGPAFAETIERVDRLLTTRAIRGLAAEMEASNDPAQAAGDVAEDFLQGYGLVAPTSWSTVTTTTATTTPLAPTGTGAVRTRTRATTTRTTGAD